MAIRRNTERVTVDTPGRGNPNPLHALDGLILPPPWTVDALCAETDPELFHPEKGGSTREAKAICAQCPVVNACLEYALERNERFGIWGGMSERDRRRLKKETAA